MNKETVKRDLKSYLDQLEIIDTHEHFTPEKYHLTNQYNFYNWFMPYIQFDLVSAGMPNKYLWNPPSTDDAVKECWKDIAPLWQYVKQGSYARPFLMALKEFYGMDDITEENYILLGERMNETRYEGRYKEILYERCHIKYILNQCGATSFEDCYMKGAYQVVNKIQLNDIISFQEKNPTAGVDDYAENLRSEILQAKKDGAVLVKFDSSCFMSVLDKDQAAIEYELIKSQGANAFKYPGVLATYLYDEALKFTEEAGLVAAVHTGVWFNITEKNPEILFPVVARHPDLKFDIYHMGMPYVRECAFLGKNYSNVFLNLCWSYIVSPQMTLNALDEWIDLVPMNKIFGFGGDFSTMPENIWAHLEMAKETLSEVFSNRIARGNMTLDDAKRILKLWMHDNPARVYGLE